MHCRSEIIPTDLTNLKFAIILAVGIAYFKVSDS
jgi:hypothetical protein